MPVLKPVPTNEQVTLEQLSNDPYPIYRQMRSESPVVHVKAAGRVFLTKAQDTKYVKSKPELFSSNDPNTPMKRAFGAHTLMRKDGLEHRRERLAMNAAFSPAVIENDWMPHYRRIASEYVARLPAGETVDLFSALSGPFAARGLAILLGLEEASDIELQEWSQALIEGAGNYGWRDEGFIRCDKANVEMNALFDRIRTRHKAEPNHSAYSVMINAENPIPESQVHANIKIAIGGGINEPRDALDTIIYGLLTNPAQLEEVRRNDDWSKAFEEGVRWVAPIQASSRLVMQDTEIRGYHIPEGATVMTIQASANRDEEIYDEGEKYQVYRDNLKHQAFGNGPHLCQGSRVARRAIGEVMLPMLFDRFPAMSIPDINQVIWKGFGFRGPVQLPVLLK
ncbi:MAG: cytochrome P450 [Granulosicoccus sp.]